MKKSLSTSSRGVSGTVIVTGLALSVTDFATQDDAHVIRNCPVMDPEAGFVQVANAGIKDGYSATVTDGEGHTLMPGLADTHVHIAFASLPQMELMTGLNGYPYVYSVGDAEAMLMRGFTVVRDMGGDTL